MRLLADYLCPADWRIDHFLREYLYDTGIAIKWPTRTFVLDSPGLARELSLPPDRDEFVSDIMQFLSPAQGVLHNPANDRRTTQGVFHVAEGGLPIPDDKLAVPKSVFARLLQLALAAARANCCGCRSLRRRREQAECFVSLLLRPVVCPGGAGIHRGEIDGDPVLRARQPGQQSGFRRNHFRQCRRSLSCPKTTRVWTSNIGPATPAASFWRRIWSRRTKKSLGLPHWDQATERQRRDGMCWKDEDEIYNNGAAFKITARDERGVIVTIIADNYFGYCKKEVKTQISYAANLFGLCEEEHAGGALVYPSYDLGEEFYAGQARALPRPFVRGSACKLAGRAHGLAAGRLCGRQEVTPTSFTCRATCDFDLREADRQLAIDRRANAASSCSPDKIYVRPSGYKVRMEKPPGDRAWRLVGTVAEGDALPQALHRLRRRQIGDFQIHQRRHHSRAGLRAPISNGISIRSARLARDAITPTVFATRQNRNGQRPILSPERSLGSVIKLFTPSDRDYSDEYNQWLATIPQYILELVFVVKRFYKPSWGDKWREHFSVDIINGTPGNELKCDNRKLVSNFLRVGYDAEGSWRVFGLRKDFHPAAKLQMEDDITASVVVPAEALKHLEPGVHQSVASNSSRIARYRLFQRPDEAIHRGYDKQTEADLAEPGNFLSNFEPLTAADARELIEDSIGFDKFTEPMQAVHP